jgi:hypothetical protein
VRHGSADPTRDASATFDIATLVIAVCVKQLLKLGLSTAVYANKLEVNAMGSSPVRVPASSCISASMQCSRHITTAIYKCGLTEIPNHVHEVNPRSRTTHQDHRQPEDQCEPYKKSLEAKDEDLAFEESLEARPSMK